MQINLKQTEIITALKQFVTSQGISLAGKEVKVDFTAGRKEAGISADIEILDIEIPAFVGETSDDKPALALVTAINVKADGAKVDDTLVGTEASTDDVAGETAVKTTSLFN